MEKRFGFRSQPLMSLKRPVVHESTSLNGSSTANKRAKPSPSPSDTASFSFRLLCHASRIGGVIGKAGAIIKSLQQQTSSTIRILPSPSECPDRIISVSSNPGTKPIKLSLSNASDAENEIELSASQAGLVKVFERVLIVAAESEGVLSDGLVFCRLLVDVTEAGSVIGKGGKVVEKIKKECGCKIRILKADSLHQGVANPTDELVEIEGNVLAVKKALVSVSCCIQECSSTNKTKITDKKSAEAFRSEVLPQLRGGLHLPQSSSFLLPTGSFERIRSQTPPELRAKLHLQQHNSFLPPMRSLEAIRRETLPESHAAVHLPVHGSSFLPSMRSIESFRSGTLPELRSELHLPQRTSFLPSLSSSSISYSSVGLGRPFSIEPDRKPANVPASYSVNSTENVSLDLKEQLDEVIFRILCANEKVGGIIGKGGTIIEALKKETGASITIGALTAECDERLITISAYENINSRYSPAQNATLLVYSRLGEAGTDKGTNPSSKKGANAMLRLVIPSNQVGCLLGKGGIIVSEIRIATGAGIHILSNDEVPKCASQNDQVVQISGDFVKVQDALYHVTSRLRENLSTHKTLHDAATVSGSSTINEINPYSKLRDHSPLFHPSVDVSHSYSRHTTLTQNMDHLGTSHNLGGRPNSPRLWESQTLAGVSLRGLTDYGAGLTSVKGGLELGSGSRSAFVTNTTVEIAIPENVIGSVYGVNGSNLARLRQISGAKVTLHEPSPGTRDRIIVISGTPDETQAAQSLLQAFILTGS